MLQSGSAPTCDTRRRPGRPVPRMVSVVADVYASIADADPALVERIAEVLELRAGDPNSRPCARPTSAMSASPTGPGCWRWAAAPGQSPGPWPPGQGWPRSPGSTRHRPSWPPPGRLQRPRPLAGAGGERAQLSLPWPDRDRPARGTLVRTPTARSVVRVGILIPSRYVTLGRDLVAVSSCQPSGHLRGASAARAVSWWRR